MFFIAMMAEAVLRRQQNMKEEQLWNRVLLWHAVALEFKIRMRYRGCSKSSKRSMPSHRTRNSRAGVPLSRRPDDHFCNTQAFVVYGQLISPVQFRAV